MLDLSDYDFMYVNFLVICVSRKVLFLLSIAFRMSITKISFVSQTGWQRPSTTYPQPKTERRLAVGVT